MLSATDIVGLLVILSYIFYTVSSAAPCRWAVYHAEHCVTRALVAP